MLGRHQSGKHFDLQHRDVGEETNTVGHARLVRLEKVGMGYTDGKAYGQAQNALQNREDLTFTDQELDAFLPGPLKRKK